MNEMYRLFRATGQTATHVEVKAFEGWFDDQREFLTDPDGMHEQLVQLYCTPEAAVRAYTGRTAAPFVLVSGTDTIAAPGTPE